MNIYRLTQTDNVGYDSYDSMVVVAENEKDARRIHPNQILEVRGDLDRDEWFTWAGAPDWTGRQPYTRTDWADKPSGVYVEWLGWAISTLNTTQIICSSFNAG